MDQQSDLSGKVALITGAGRGIGSGIARVLAHAGSNVAVNALTPTYLEPLTQDIARATGRDVRAYPGDMTRTGSVDRIVAKVIRDFGRIDVLVNALGDAIPKPLVPLPGAANGAERLSDGELDRILNLNLVSAILTARAVAPHMLERGSGKVINISGYAASKGGSSSSIYTAAKSALGGLTRALALEWAPYNVQVNAIAPGLFPDVTTAGEEAVGRLRDRAKTTIPAGRVGEIQEVGFLALYLASANSDYMTGQTLYLDGGFTIQ